MTEFISFQNNLKIVINFIGLQSNFYTYFLFWSKTMGNFHINSMIFHSRNLNMLGPNIFNLGIINKIVFLIIGKGENEERWILTVVNEK